MKNKFYITTPIYYVNDKPHIGHAYTTIAADVLTRAAKLQGRDAFFLTGTDEHGMKIQKEIEKSSKESQAFVDEVSGEFKNLWEKLDIRYDNFIRTTDEKHKEAVQRVLQTLFDKGAIYKGEYEGLYCTGCEQFLNESDLVEGKCPDHNTVPEKMKEESYLLKMTEVQNKLIEKIESDEFEITPEKYKNEILSFLKNQELRDVSISRKNVSWGVKLPFDENHTSYVWLDAFLNYLTGIGWDGDENNTPEKWPVDTQLIGKDILRVHGTIWPAILIHLGIELPKKIFVHGHIRSGGKKMSKTLGNAISIEDMIEKFGVEGTRYLLLSAGTFGDDVDVTMERMTEKYNADLANGLGNLVSRVIKLSEDVDIHLNEYKNKDDLKFIIEDIRLDYSLETIWRFIKSSNQHIEDNKPWELKKTDSKKFEEIMRKLINELDVIGAMLESFMPETSKKIKKALETKETEILFKRIK